MPRTLYPLTPPNERIAEAVWVRLIAGRYPYCTRGNYMSRVRRFLRFLEVSRRDIASLSPSDIEDFLRVKPTKIHENNIMRSAISFVLAVARPGFYPPDADSRRRSSEESDLLDRYEHYMANVRGIVESTRKKRIAEFKRLQDWCFSGKLQIAELKLDDIERFMRARSKRMKRTSHRGLATTLRSALKFLQADDVLQNNLASLLKSPRLYRDEGIPSCPTRAQILRAVEHSAKDQSIKGIRDHAALLLLITYGLRAAEVTGLRLVDIDWRRNRLNITHRKSREQTSLPLLATVGNALLQYVRKVPPDSPHLKLFRRLQAPAGPIGSSGLYHIVVGAFARVGIRVSGKRGPHSLRHACAVGLLREGATLKLIGDLLGHQAASSTSTYLKLATEDLRDMSLDLAVEVRHG